MSGIPLSESFVGKNLPKPGPCPCGCGRPVKPRTNSHKYATEGCRLRADRERVRKAYAAKKAAKV